MVIVTPMIVIVNTEDRDTNTAILGVYEYLGPYYDSHC
jgi:hypothetical protein